MRISYSWLQDFVDIDILGLDPEELGKTLTTVGLAVELIEEVDDDIVYDLDVTSNRSDCLNHLGVAREIAAYHRLNLRHPDFEAPGFSEDEAASYPVSVEIRDEELCPRYSARVIADVKTGESPDWLKARLEAIGQRPINNLVDITNYVLFEVGQPLHAFDYTKLGGGRIVVRRASEGEKIVTLDEVERSLDSSMLAICDESDPVAVAGVMGGLESEIEEGSSTILLESAYFEPIQIRKTARKLGMSTEASFRFERGADPEGTVKALNLATRMIIELCGGRCVSPVIDVNPVPYTRKDLVLRKGGIKRLLGIDIPEVQVEEILKYLEFNPERDSDGNFKVKVPGYRSDVEFEADLVEEAARHHGYENIPGTYPPPAVPGRVSDTAAQEKIVVNYLVEAGFYESVNYSLTTPADEEYFFGKISPMTAMANPLTEDATHLRTTLIPGLMASLRRNLNLGNRDPRLFEIGNVFPADDGSLEKSNLAIAACGANSRHFLDSRDNEFSYYHLKGILEDLLDKLSLKAVYARTSELTLLHPGVGARIQLEDGRDLGFAGQMHPSLQERMKIQEPVFLAELDMSLLGGKSLPSPRYETYSRFPSVERDLSFLLDRSVEFARIRNEIKELGLHGLQDFCLIDLYQGSNISDDKVSLTVRMVFSDPAKTLVQEEVDAACESVRDLLKNSFSAEMR